MKKLIGSLLIVLGLCFSGFAQEPPVEIYYKGECVHKMTLEQWSALTGAAELFYKEFDAETSKPRRLRIVLKDNIWTMDNPDKFETEMSIQWLDEKGKVFKELFADIEIVIDEKTRKFSKWRIKYRDVAETVAPISVLFNILLIILIAL